MANKNKEELYNSLKAKQLQVRKELEDFKEECEADKDSNSSGGSKKGKEDL